jgi:hypothetical protein
MPSKSGDPRLTYEWQLLRKAIRAEARRIDAPCGICGGPIDYTISGRWPMGCSVDHGLSVKDYPSLALSGAALRVVHTKCNTARANKDRAKRNAQQNIKTSQKW